VDHTTDGDVVLVAHSFGGYLARVYAERHPERIRGIVFVDALDPSVGLLRGTGADELREIAMADEQLDLRALESAAAAVTELPDDIEIRVLVGGEGNAYGVGCAADGVVPAGEHEQVECLFVCGVFGEAFPQVVVDVGGFVQSVDCLQ
jgi:pimeloyl-ACP methyl ester carboxylesterase